MKSWAETYNLKFHERILPESQRNLVGLQAAARDWRRSECFNLLKIRGQSGLNSDIGSNLQSVTLPGTEFETKKSCFDGQNLPLSSVFATAHHCDDQQETMLLKFLRGAYITHLQPVSFQNDESACSAHGLLINAVIDVLYCNN